MNNPYVGLRPFDESEQDRFFGRDQDRRIFVDLLLANRLTLLFAGSGVGKSSLLRAAVLPQLTDPARENLDAVYCNSWAGNPLTSIRGAALEALIKARRLPEAARQELAELPLPRFFEICGHVSRCPLVLVLDQFEEFFYYHREGKDFPTIREQLVRLILDEALPLSVVIAMREDFALSLNAFKPDLPTVLFNNFYRLERLPLAAAREAIERPLEQVGYGYEPELLDQLLKDLATRDRDRRVRGALTEDVLTVEPPYLQIICEQLFELDRGDPEKKLRLSTYRAHGEAQGLRTQYTEGKLNALSYPQKRIASGCISHLVAHRGTKVAHTAATLAKVIVADEAATLLVLGELEKARLLRKYAQEDDLWFELYHDMFSESLGSWNDDFRARERLKRTLTRIGGVILGGVLLFSAQNIYVNMTSYHLRLSDTGRDDQLELWRGKDSALDPFNFHRFEGELGISRSQLEVGSIQARTSLDKREDAYTAAIGMQRAQERIQALAQHGNQRHLLNQIVAILSNTKGDSQNFSSILSLNSSVIINFFAHMYNRNSDMHRNSFYGTSYSNTVETGLISYLNDDKNKAAVNKGYSAAIIRLFGAWRTQRAIPSLLDILVKGRPDEQDEASKALIEISTENATRTHELIEKIIQLVHTEKGNRTIDTLIALAKNSSNKEQQQLGRSLSELLRKESSPTKRIRLLVALGDLRCGDVQVILNLLKDSNERVAIQAATTLSKLPGRNTRVLAAIEEFTKNHNLSKAGLQGEHLLAFQGDLKALRRVVFRYQNHSLDFQPWKCANEELSIYLHLDPKKIISLIKPLHEKLQENVLSCLPESPTPVLFSILLNANTDYKLKTIAVRLLKWTEGSAISDLLLKLAETASTSEPLRAAALDALVIHGPAGREETKQQHFLAVLLKLMRSNMTEQVRLLAMDAYVRWAARSKMQILVTFLDDREPEIRRRALSYIHQTMDRQTVNKFKQKLFAQEEKINEELLSALYQLDESYANRALDRVLQTPSTAVNDLDEIRRISLANPGHITPSLIFKAARSKESLIRDYAIEYINSTGIYENENPLSIYMDIEERANWASNNQGWSKLFDYIKWLPIPSAAEGMKMWLEQSSLDIPVASEFILSTSEPQIAQRILDIRSAYPYPYPRERIEASICSMGGTKLGAQALDAIGCLDYEGLDEDSLISLLEQADNARSNRLNSLLLKRLRALTDYSFSFVQKSFDLFNKKGGPIAREVFTISIQRDLGMGMSLTDWKSFMDVILREKSRPNAISLDFRDNRKEEFTHQRFIDACDIFQDQTDRFQFLTDAQRIRLANEVGSHRLFCSRNILPVLAHDPSPLVRAAAAANLWTMQIKQADVLPTLYSLLSKDEKSGAVRLAAAKSLEKLAAPESVPVIDAALKSDTPPLIVCLHLLRALGKINTPEATMAILDAINQNENVLGIYGYRVIGEMKTNDKNRELLKILISRLSHLKGQVFQILYSPSLPKANSRNSLEPPSSYLIYELAHTIVRLLDIKNIASITPYLAHQLADVREATALALARRRDVGLLELLATTWAETHDPLERHAAFRAIDLGLRVLDRYGNDEDLAKLRVFQSRMNGEDPTTNAVLDRVNYTITELADRLEEEHGQAGAAAPQN